MTLDSYQRNRIRTLRPIMQLLSATPRSGAAKRQAAEATGFSAGRIEALHREWQALGDDALIDRRKLPKVRRSAADTLPISEAERAGLRRLTAQCGSMLPFFPVYIGGRIAEGVF